MKNPDHFKKKLIEERELLLRELKEIGMVKDSRNPGDWQAIPADIGIERADSNDVADRIESYEGNNALVHELEIRLGEVDTALQKIATHSFGTCEVCKKPIEEDRLGANPAAKTCKAHMNS